MIAKLKGIIDEIKPSEMILDVSGVGYRVFIPFSTYEKISGEKSVILYIYTLHKEEQFRLYGFYSAEEKDFFTLLLNISGIGPSMALTILSGIRINRFVEAVKNGDISSLIKIPGIGKTRAEKILFELKRKIKKLETFSGDERMENSIREDAVEALVSLGFDESKTILAVDQILQRDASLDLEQIIKASLKYFSD